MCFVPHLLLPLHYIMVPTLLCLLMTLRSALIWVKRLKALRRASATVKLPMVLNSATLLLNILPNLSKAKLLFLPQPMVRDCCTWRLRGAQAISLPDHFLTWDRYAITLLRKINLCSWHARHGKTGLISRIHSLQVPLLKSSEIILMSIAMLRVLQNHCLKKQVPTCLTFYGKKMPRITSDLQDLVLKRICGIV